MKFDYNKDDDVLKITLNGEKIYYAQQSGSMIVHFSKFKKAVLLEILDASKFLKKLFTSIPSAIVDKLFPSRPATATFNADK